MMNSRKRGSALPGLCMLIAGWIALVCTTAWAQSRNVTLVVPYGPGGNIDLNARIIAALVKPYVGEPWVVINRPGGTGNTGLAEVMRAKPDGRTMILTGGAFMLQALTADVPFKSNDDFEQIAITLATFNVHFVRADAPWKTMADLVEHSKKNPRAVNYGVTGPNGVGTVRYLMLRQATGILWTEVPFTGDAETMTAVLGGHIETGAAAAPGVISQARAGKVRILAVPAAERVPTMPDVPTFREMGYPVVLPSLNVILGPKGIPADVLKGITSAIERATNSPEYRKFADDNSGVADVRFGDQMKAAMNEQMTGYRGIAPMLKEYMKSNRN